MAQGFYELLGVGEDAAPPDIRDAYQRRLAELVRRRRGAQAQGADVSILEGQERALREAMEILSDPARRRRYDALRKASREDWPEDAEALWASAREALVDPGTLAAVQAVRSLTELPLSDAPAGPATAAPPPSAIQAPAPAPTPAPATPPASSPSIPSPHPTIEESEVPTTPDVQRTVPELAAALGHDGRFLGAVRELRGLTLDDLSRETRIDRRYLEAIEANAFARLPAATFVRGYVRQVARVLDLEDSGVVDDFMDLVRRKRG